MERRITGSAGATAPLMPGLIGGRLTVPEIVGAEGPPPVEKPPIVGVVLGPTSGGKLEFGDGSFTLGGVTEIPPLPTLSRSRNAILRSSPIEHSEREFSGPNRHRYSSLQILESGTEPCYG